MTPRQVRKFCALRPESMSLLKAAMEDLSLSARAHDKVLRVARTIADLEGSDDIKPQHIAEAVDIGRWIGAFGRDDSNRRSLLVAAVSSRAHEPARSRGPR